MKDAALTWSFESLGALVASFGENLNVNWLIESRLRAEGGCPESACRGDALCLAGSFFGVVLVSVCVSNKGR